MADFSGCLYPFYTNEKYFENKFIEEIQKHIGYLFQRSEYKGECFLLFYKDTEMLEFHYENGYCLNDYGFGCFGLEIKNIQQFNAITNLHNFDNQSDFESYDINLYFKDIIYILLILPENIENNAFSKFIYNTLRKSFA